ncbi:MAG: cytochrome P450 [Chloroflexales bacterium]|nr:cytochrome P450 [Chloroflexales bacterium]
MNIVAETLFGAISPRQPHTIGQALHQSMDYFTNDPLRDIAASITRLPLHTAKDAAYAQAIGALDTVMDEIIAERIDQPRESTDLLGMFMAARDDDNQPKSHSQLRDDCKTLIWAGHETTAITLTWSIWLLLCHPDCIQTMHANSRRLLVSDYQPWPISPIWSIPSKSSAKQCAYTHPHIPLLARVLPM